MKLKIPYEKDERDVEYLGDVLCISSKEYNPDKEFTKNNVYKLYKNQLDHYTIYIVQHKNNKCVVFGDIKNLYNERYSFKYKTNS